MKNYFFILVLASTLCFGQRSETTKLGLTSLEEVQLKVYEKDSSANALVLYEHGNLYVDDRNKHYFRTDFYHRVKLFNKESFDRATVSIKLYNKQKIKNIKAITYNLFEGEVVKKEHLLENKIFKKKLNDNWNEVTFTMPKVKEGSVIEYVYSVISPYYELDDWYFQSDIPKVKSEYTSAILGNWKYNIRIIGYLSLDKDRPSVKKDCLYLPNGGLVDCSFLSYGMNDIPAFKEEDYMLSKKNFISRLVFDLISFTDTNGRVSEYTKSWKAVDRVFRNDYLDGQTSKRSFFRSNLPSAILTMKDDLNRAKKVFEFIRDRLIWNGNYWTSSLLKIKSIFKGKVGGADAINLILYNSLKAAKLKPSLVMISTRDNGLITKLYPVTSDFNYLIIKTTINGKEYFLDATNKNLPFGILPLRCMNGEGRVLDFKTGGYWQEIVVNKQTSKRTKIRLELNEEGFKGTMQINKTGYFAFNQREKINSQSEDEYLENFEADYPSIEVVEYAVKNEKNFEKQLQETYQIVIEEDFENSNNLRIYPFIIGRTTVNPFKLDQRDYPVDFGYTRNNTYLLSLKIPEGYKVSKLPENKSLGLPNKGGSFTFNIQQKEDKINLFFKSRIKKTRFSSVEYFYLKEFFKQLIKVQGSYIEFIKK